MTKTLPFICFQIFFFAMMWMSKTLHPIFFENQGHLANFGLSYSAMALAGYFSFLTGSITDRIGAKKTLGLGVVLYGMGLSLRAFPETAPVAILSGFICGIGAAATLTSLRLWMLDLSCEKTQTRMVGLKSSTTALGTAIGCALAGFLPGLSVFKISMQSLLFGTGVLLFIAGLTLLYSSTSLQSHKAITKKSPWHDLKTVFTQYRELSAFTSTIGVLTGLYVSFISPYLPLIMKDKGLTMSSIGLSIGAFSLIRFFADPLIAKWIDKNKSNSLTIFLTAELSILIITGLFTLSVSKYSFIGFLVIRSLALGFSTIAEELLWIQKFPKQLVGLLFGLNQSAFFVGDFLGGLVNGTLYQKFGLTACVVVALVTILTNSYLFIVLFKRKNSVPTEILAPVSV